MQDTLYIKQLKEEISSTYDIFSDGRVVNRKRGTDMKFSLDEKGYPKARIWCPAFSKNKDKRLNFRMHKLVAMFHLNDYRPDLQVNHKNGIKTDNRVQNLEMVTAKENSVHAWNVLDSSERRKAVGMRRLGKRHTAEAKKRMSIAHSGINNSWLGKHHSLETRKKMRQSALRRTRTSKIWDNTIYPKEIISK